MNLKKAGTFEREQILYKLSKNKTKKKNRNGEIKEASDEPVESISSNQILPQPTIDASMSESGLLIEEEQEPTNPLETVTQDEETSVIIRHPSTLKNLYINDPTFSESIHFNFIFSLIIFWETLAEQSKKHKQRLDEIKKDAKARFSLSGAMKQS